MALESTNPVEPFAEAASSASARMIERAHKSVCRCGAGVAEPGLV